MDDHHVVTAVGRDFADVPPNRGVWKGNAKETISVTVKVEPLERMPADWADLNNPAEWSGAGFTQTQRQARSRGGKLQAQNRTLYRHQQSQQQQAVSLLFVPVQR